MTGHAGLSGVQPVVRVCGEQRWLPQFPQQEGDARDADHERDEEDLLGSIHDDGIIRMLPGRGAEPTFKQGEASASEHACGVVPSRQ